MKLKDDSYDWQKEKIIKTLNRYSFKVLNDKIIFDKAHQDVLDTAFYDSVRSNFYFDGIYKVTCENDNNSYYFRHGFQIRNQNNEVEFLNVNWLTIPPKNTKNSLIQIVDIPFIQSGTKKISMIGDSNVWWDNGQEFRKTLDSLIPEYIFTGSRTDIYGYGHEGEGGNNSHDVLDRIHKIPKADIYTLLIGTNDRKILNNTPEISYHNIENIIDALIKKSPNSIIYILTILPRVHEIDNLFNEEINKKIIERIPQKFSSNVKVIDTNYFLKNQPDWPDLTTDGLHLTKEGYLKLSQFLAKKME